MIAKCYDEDGRLIGTKEVEPTFPKYEYSDLETQLRADEINMRTLFDRDVWIPNVHVVAWHFYQQAAGNVSHVLGD